MRINKCLLPILLFTFCYFTLASASSSPILITGKIVNASTQAWWDVGLDLYPQPTTYLAPTTVDIPYFRIPSAKNPVVGSFTITLPVGKSTTECLRSNYSLSHCCFTVTALSDSHAAISNVQNGMGNYFNCQFSGDFDANTALINIVEKNSG